MIHGGETSSQPRYARRRRLDVDIFSGGGKRVSYLDLEPSYGRGQAVAAATLSIALHPNVFALLVLAATRVATSF